MTPKNAVGNPWAVDIWTETLPPQYWWDPAAPMRGTEEFYVRTAECLAERGYQVRVIYDGPSCTLRGVAYFNRGESMARNWDQWRGEVVLWCNDPESACPVFRGASETPRIIRWTNKYGDRPSTLGVFHDYVVISEFQKSIYSPLAHVVGHGCEPTSPAPSTKANLALFSSSPDRGLDFLKSIWPRVGSATGVKLLYSDGSSSNQEMDAYYAESKYWLHPGLGVELFCISALKAQAAGCIPCVVPHMALAETVKYGLKTSLDRYERDLIAFFKSDPKPEPFTAPTWAQVTAQLAALWECK